MSSLKSQLSNKPKQCILTALNFSTLFTTLQTIFCICTQSGNVAGAWLSWTGGSLVLCLFAVLTVFFKTIGMIASVPSGLCIGPEGPIIHVSALMAHWTCIGTLNKLIYLSIYNI